MRYDLQVHIPQEFRGKPMAQTIATFPTAALRQSHADKYPLTSYSFVDTDPKLAKAKPQPQARYVREELEE